MEDELRSGVTEAHLSLRDRKLKTVDFAGMYKAEVEAIV